MLEVNPESVKYITELSNGMYVTQGSVFLTVEQAYGHIRATWPDHPVKIIKAEEHTNAYWLNVIGEKKS